MYAYVIIEGRNDCLKSCITDTIIVLFPSNVLGYMNVNLQSNKNHSENADTSTYVTFDICCGPYDKVKNIEVI